MAYSNLIGAGSASDNSLQPIINDQLFEVENMIPQHKQADL